MKKIIVGFIALAISSASLATIQIHAPFSIGQSWRSSTYLPSHSGVGTFKAVDFNRDGGDNGADVTATHDGLAVRRYSPVYGSYVEITGLGGHLKTLVAHLNTDQSVSPPTWSSKRVQAGELIGKCGRTGSADGTHIHLEVFWKGIRQDVTKSITLDGQWITFGAANAAGNIYGNSITSRPGEWDWHTLQGQTWQPLATSDTDGRLYFMHTGNSSTNGIYYSSMGGIGIPPSTWTQLPGATALGLAMTHLGTTRYIAHRSISTDNKIYFGELNGTNFGGWSWTGETSSAAPALCEVNGEIYLLHKGNNEDRRMLLHAWRAGQGWRAHEVLPGLTNHAPVLAKFKGQLWAAHRGTSGDGQIFASNLGVNHAWQWVMNPTAKATSPIPPSMFEWEGRLYLAHRGNSNNYIYLWSTSGANDWKLELIDTAATVATPGLFTFYNRLYLTRVLPGGVMAFKRIG